MVHPVARTHPESRERILYVNEAFTTHSPTTSRRSSPWSARLQLAQTGLLHYLLRQAAIPEYQMRLRWSPTPS